jgi:hypothetical protein
MTTNARSVLLYSLLLVAVATACGFFYIHNWRAVASFGTTTGQIIVDTPEVYSRERLVNDRFKQAAWLDEQLKATDSLPWGIQASVRSRSSRTRDVEVTAQGHVGGDKVHPAMTPTDASAGKTTVVPAGEDTQTNTLHELTSSPIDVFRDKLAYREEVRAAEMETQLDDRHDIAGNTLYRMKFSATVLPEQDTSAWALVYVELAGLPENEHGRPNYEDIYSEWLHSYEDQLNQELDRLVATLTATNIVTDPSMRPQVVDATKFRDFVDRAFAERLCLAHGLDCPVDHPLPERIETERTRLVLDAQRILAAPMRQFAETMYKACITAKQPGVSCAPVNCADGEPCPWTLDPQSRVRSMALAYRNTEYPQSGPHPSANEFITTLAARYLVQSLQDRMAPDLWKRLWNVGTAQCGIGLCRITLGSVPNGATALREALDTGTQVFSYAVSPKESVQRVANLANSQRERQLALRASVDADNVPLERLTALLKDNQEDDMLMSSILRRPLVVGFSESEASERKSQDDDRTAAFGWVIGPRFESAQEGGMRFRHMTVANDLSAIISVPSWWRWSQVRVSTCWVDEREVVRHGNALVHGLEDYAGCKGGTPNRTSHKIRLPGSAAEISRRLGFDVVRRPSVLPSTDLPRVVRVGERAELLIPGYHLWRSTVVTLGTQMADEIIVLPDMKGIVATFKEIYSQAEDGANHFQEFGLAPNRAGESRSGAAPLVVWTSEGSAYVGGITVLPRLVADQARAHADQSGIGSVALAVPGTIRTRGSDQRIIDKTSDRERARRSARR